MILVDTSVLIDFFKGVSNDLVEHFVGLCDAKVPFVINSYIYQEILQGAQTALENDLVLLHNDNDFTAIKKVLPELKTF
jgi:predicted nucleic acid-binding protein